MIELPESGPWKRIERIGDAVLLMGDCLEILPHLPKVDAVITDPPYSIRNQMGVVQLKRGGTRRLQFSWDGTSSRDEVIHGVALACDLAEAFFVFCGASQVSFLEMTLEQRFTVKPAVWIKACPPPAMPGNWWPSGFEYALYGYCPGAYFGDTDAKRRNVFYSDTYRAGIRADEKVDHPTQKWLPLIEHIVGSVVPPAGTCLDPFMGSGTTGVACANLGRSFLGIEIEPRYFDVACTRIDNAYRQSRLFA